MLTYYLRATLKYVAVKHGFNRDPKIGHLVISLICSNSAVTVLDIQGVISVKVEGVDNMLKEDKVQIKLLKIVLDNLLPNCNNK